MLMPPLLARIEASVLQVVEEKVAPALVERVVASLTDELIPPLRGARRVDTISARIRCEFDGTRRQCWCPVSISPLVLITFLAS